LANLGEPWRTLANLGEPWRTLANLGEPWQTLANLGEPWRSLANDGSLILSLSLSLSLKLGVQFCAVLCWPVVFPSSPKQYFLFFFNANAIYKELSCGFIVE
jgi:hypothetical protein